MTINSGQKAPLFEIETQDGTPFSLAAHKGQKVLIYFYPKDDTPGCTQESCDFRDAFSELKERGVAVIGISKDSIASHEKFAKKYALPFALGADTDQAVLKAYDVWVEKKLYGRTYMGIERATFLVDKTGKIEKIWRRVKVKNHVKEILDYLNKPQ